MVFEEMKLSKKYSDVKKIKMEQEFLEVKLFLIIKKMKKEQT